MSKDLVTIIIPVYNGSRFISDALRSVQAQLFQNWECIVVDDGSTDQTAQIIKQWTLADKRFTYLFQENKGLSAARNKGLDNANGDFIQFLDADDVLLPEKIEKQIRVSMGNSNLLSYTDYSSGSSDDIFVPAQFHITPKFDHSNALFEFIKRWESKLVIPPHCFLFSSFFFRAEKIRFDCSLPNHEDFDCWIRIFNLHPEIKYIDEKLCIYRNTESSMSKNMSLMCQGFIQVLNKHLQLHDYSPKIRKLLAWKRMEVLKAYNRFDKMTLREKMLMIHYIIPYYRKRLLQKTGIIK